jgi:hypothetical protein
MLLLPSSGQEFVQRRNDLLTISSGCKTTGVLRLESRIETRTAYFTYSRLPHQRNNSAAVVVRKTDPKPLKERKKPYIRRGHNSRRESSPDIYW